MFTDKHLSLFYYGKYSQSFDNLLICEGACDFSTCDSFDMFNGIVAHVHKEDHQIDLEDVEVLGEQEFNWKRRVRKEIRIHQCGQVLMNLDCGLSLGGMSRSTFSMHLILVHYHFDFQFLTPPTFIYSNTI